MLEMILKSIKELYETEQVSVQVEKLLKVMDQIPLSTIDLMKLLQLKHRPSFRDNYLLPAIKAGLIEMIFPDKPNSSKQKYRKL